MHLSHKILLDATAQQRVYFNMAAGVHRFVYNWGLEACRKASPKKVDLRSLKVKFNSIYKEDFPWAANVHRDCRSQPFADLQAAFTKFKLRLSSEPSFKSRRKSRASFYAANDKVSFFGKSIKLPRVGLIKMKEAIRLQGKVMSVRIVEDAGQWFACVAVDVGDLKKERAGAGIVGVDLGLKKLATLSTGEQFENPRPLKKAQGKLRRAQRRMSKRKFGSKNRDKQRLVVAKIHQLVKNIRHDGLHKLTTRLCRENQTVVIEDLSPSNMVKNRSLAQAISDASFGLFRRMMGYKAKIYGTSIIVADRYFPSSKTCSSCGHVKAEMPLKERVFHCESCGLKIDRDLNAAINLEKLGRATPEVTPTEMPVGIIEVGIKPQPLVAT